MEELLKNKLNSAIELKKFTAEIRDLSLTTQYDTVNTMLGERQKMIDNINSINEKINNKNIDNIVKSKELINIDKEIKEVFAGIAELDNLIRKNINNSFKDVKEKLNYSAAHSNSVNIRV